MNEHTEQSAVSTAAFAQNSKAAIIGQETSLFASKEVETICSSHRHGWQELFAAHTLEHPHDSNHRSVPFFWISMGLQDTHVHRTISGREQLAVLPAYSITLAEPLTSVDCHIGNETEAVHVYLRPDLLYEVANELFDMNADRVSLLPAFGEKSTSLSWLLRSIKQSLGEPASLSKMKMSYLARALSADLLAKYSATSVSPIDPAHMGSLTSRQLRRVDDYILEHLGKEIQINELADLCAMGRTTFYQRFRSATHMTPHQYIMRLRVDKAKRLLGETPWPLAEVGIACGFSDQAHFASVFRRLAGTTPALFRRSTE